MLHDAEAHPSPDLDLETPPSLGLGVGFGGTRRATYASSVRSSWTMCDSLSVNAPSSPTPSSGVHVHDPQSYSYSYSYTQTHTHTRTPSRSSPYSYPSSSSSPHPSPPAHDMRETAAGRGAVGIPLGGLGLHDALAGLDDGRVDVRVGGVAVAKGAL